MNANSEQSVREQLLAELDFARERIGRFQSRLAATSADVRATFDQQVERVLDRVEALGAQLKDRRELQIGTLSAVEDLSEAVDTLEADLDVAGEADAGSYRSLVDRQLRVWKGRAEHLRVQESLGAMELREELDGLTRRLADSRSVALVELRRAAADAREVAVDLRDDLEEVLVDVRRVVERAADALVRHSDTSG